MTAVAGGDDEARTIWIPRDPEVAVPRVAVEADARVRDGRVAQFWKSSGDERAHLLRFFRRHHSLGRFGMHGPTWTMPRDLDDAFLRMKRKSVVPGRGDVRAEDGKSLGDERARILRNKVEHRMPGRAKLGGERGKRMRCPGAEREDDLLGLDPL